MVGWSGNQLGYSKGIERKIYMIRDVEEWPSTVQIRFIWLSRLNIHPSAESLNHLSDDYTSYRKSAIPAIHVRPISQVFDQWFCPKQITLTRHCRLDIPPRL